MWNKTFEICVSLLVLLAAATAGRASTIPVTNLGNSGAGSLRHRFDSIPTGPTYVIWVGHKRYQFANNPRVLSVLGEIMDADFVAEP